MECLIFAGFPAIVLKFWAVAASSPLELIHRVTVVASLLILLFTGNPIFPVIGLYVPIALSNPFEEFG